MPLQPIQTLTQQDCAPGGFPLAVLPLGAVEAHGPHLPLGTDGFIAEGLLSHMAVHHPPQAQVLRLPLIWLGASAEHAARPGTLSREPEALIQVIVDCADGLAAMGVQRLILFNAHGGNVAAAQIAALKLRTRHRMLVATPHWLDFGLPDGIAPDLAASAGRDWHGGWVETSLMLALHQALVRLERLPDDAAPRAPVSPPAPMLAPTGPIGWGWHTDDVVAGNSGGYIGLPRLARADLGEMLASHASQHLSRLMDQIAGADWPF